MNFLISVVLACALLVQFPSASASDTSQQAVPTTGVVAETMVSGGYVYLKLEDQGGWIATSPRPQPITVGDKVEYTGGMEMRNFHSRTLDKTFESIMFVQNVKVAGKDINALHAAAVSGHSGMAIPLPKPDSVEKPDPGEIAPVAGGKTIADIYANLPQLKEQSISVRARVIKFSEDILGKNWVTLQDGTGTEPDNILRATTTEVVAPGDTVIGKGVVRTDINIGSGYKYKVLLEEATFSTQAE